MDKRYDCRVGKPMPSKRWLSLLFFGLQMFSVVAQTVVSGAERMELYLDRVRQCRVAVVANQCTRVGGVHLVDTLRRSGVDVGCIFCPEHGFRGTAEAGAKVEDGVDPKTGIPIVSLYGKNRKPTPQQLQGIGLVLFDLQDVGCRFYTYISTLHYVMEACAEAGVPMVLLDRPNPNGHYIDGPVMEEKYRSFVGMHSGVPIVYGMSIGEYGQMIVGERWINQADSLQLTVIPMLHYRHDSACCRGIVLNVPPSPNLRTPQSIALYPSICLLEGTRISLGRGTDYPFEVIGNNQEMDLRQVSVPSCIDLQYVLQLYRQTSLGDFFLPGSNFFEKLAGTATLRQQMEAGLGESEIRATWQEGLARFRKMRARYLLYE